MRVAELVANERVSELEATLWVVFRG